MSVNMYYVYSIPVKLQTNITEVPVKLCSILIKDINTNGIISNTNPWNCNIESSVGSIKLDMLSNDDNNNNDSRMENIITLPSIKVMISINQISSMGRRIGLIITIIINLILL